MTIFIPTLSAIIGYKLYLSLAVKFHHVVEGFICELNVKTPFDAIEKPVVSKTEPWFEINPKIFKENTLQFKNNILSLKQNKSLNNLVNLDMYILKRFFIIEIV